MGSGSGAGNIGHVHTHMSHEHTCVPAAPREHMSHECTHIQRHARTHTSRGHAHTHTAPGHTCYMNARAHTHIYMPTRERTPRARSCERRRRQHEDRKTQEAGEEMRPKFRGRGAGLRPGQGCPRTGVCAGRADHRAPQDPGPCALVRSGRHGGSASLPSRTAAVSPACLALVHPPRFPKALGGGGEGSWKPPRLSPRLRPPAPGHAGRSAGPEQ